MIIHCKTRFRKADLLHIECERGKENKFHFRIYVRLKVSAIRPEKTLPVLP
jgi:hypothetical protein